jgi:hypothetical protein
MLNTKRYFGVKKNQKMNCKGYENCIIIDRGYIMGKREFCVQFSNPQSPSSISKDEFIKKNKTFSKIMSCKINNEIIDIKSYRGILKCFIPPIIFTVARGEKHYYTNNANRSCKKIVNLCDDYNIPFEIKIKLQNGEIVEFKL